MKVLALAFLLLTAPAFAQQPPPAPPYVAPDAELWGLMARAFDDMLATDVQHQQYKQIFTNVQEEARRRISRAEAEAKRPPPQSAAPSK